MSYRPKLVTAAIGKTAYHGGADASISPPKERYGLPNDNVVRPKQPEAFDDPLTDILRNGARALLAQAVEAEVTDFLGKQIDLKTSEVLTC